MCSLNERIQLMKFYFPFFIITNIPKNISYVSPGSLVGVFPQYHMRHGVVSSESLHVSSLIR